MGNMKITSARYTGQFNRFEDCPPIGNPEFAFIGRSNVGKSSLINLLTHQKGLAKVSTTPGKTRAIQFFNINEGFYLVDLPGYGYAKVSHSENDDFNVVTAAYLAQRAALKTIFLLIDSRHEPQDADLQFLTWIQPFNRELVLTFTKCDLSPKPVMQGHIAAFQARMADLGMPPCNHLSCSSKSGAGKTRIYEHIQKHLPKPDKQEVKKKKSSSAWLKHV
jgi:GTP-binding protein